MYPPAPSVPVLGPDCINRTVYDMQLWTGCPLYDEQHRFLGRKGPFSFRPTASSSGAIELVRDGSSRRFHAIVKYAHNGGFVCC